MGQLSHSNGTIDTQLEQSTECVPKFAYEVDSLKNGETGVELTKEPTFTVTFSSTSLQQSSPTTIRIGEGSFGFVAFFFFQCFPAASPRCPLSRACHIQRLADSKAASVASLWGGSAATPQTFPYHLHAMLQKVWYGGGPFG